MFFSKTRVAFVFLKVFSIFPWQILTIKKHYLPTPMHLSLRTYFFYSCALEHDCVFQSHCPVVTPMLFMCTWAWLCISITMSRRVTPQLFIIQASPTDWIGHRFLSIPTFSDFLHAHLSMTGYFNHNVPSCYTPVIHHAGISNRFGHQFLSIPTFSVQKSDWEIFPYWEKSCYFSKSLLRFFLGVDESCAKVQPIILT